ncbi:GDSL-type esterase/lipase family protein [Rariglobus hedericola]|uniref:Cellulose-binding protein n=1 Tax=Rariglobus hedericola TaxID=2597822 RepID=A0A556QL46_9BACT|nr:GDSL-type esterase/lipase family protein [Rariglobus hedericola]TSJ77380.1 cellulose-binding protein [Rariglobus hedericola]
MPALCRLAAIACLGFLASQAAGDASPAGVTTLMPLGDSITEGGEGFHVYRYPLMEKLLQAGYRVAYVGSKTTRPVEGSPLGVLSHEGYAGQNAAFIRARFETLYRQNPADIILVHAGHNQFADQLPIPGLIKDTTAIITTARSINPKVIVLLAQVIPSGKLPKYSYIPELNQQLATLAARLTTTASPVVIVDQASGFDWKTDTVADHVHPNQQGADKMAARWFDALTRVLPPPKPPVTGR